MKLESELEYVRRGARQVLMRTARTQNAAKQSGWLIDQARTIKGVLAGLAMLSEFETEEYFAQYEADINSDPEILAGAPILHLFPA